MNFFLIITLYVVKQSSRRMYLSMFPLFLFFMMAINEFYQRILWVAVVLFECCIIHSVLSMTQIVTPDITRSIPIKVPVDRIKFASEQASVSVVDRNF